MKHRTARQLVAQLSYLRHLVRCSALRASATGGTMVRSPSQEVARRAASIELVGPAAGRDSFVGAARESHL